MLLRTSKGMYQVIKNTKNAFELQAFESKYIEECFDVYPYIVGDLSSNILRLKGFSEDPKAPHYYKNINDYIFESCAFRCPVYVLKRIKSENEFEHLLKNPMPVDLGEEKKITLVRENFDKETLVLESTPKNQPNIIIDMNKINSIPKHTLPSDLELIKQQEENNPKNQNRQNNNQNRSNNNHNKQNQNQGKQNQNQPNNNQNKQTNQSNSNNSGNITNKNQQNNQKEKNNNNEKNQNKSNNKHFHKNHKQQMNKEKANSQK